MAQARTPLKDEIGIDVSEAKIQEIIAEASTASCTKLSNKEALAVMKHRRGFSVDATDEEVLGVGAMMKPAQR